MRTARRSIGKLSGQRPKTTATPVDNDHLIDAVMEYDQPFHAITLLPVERPTVAQIKVLRELSLIRHTNLLEVRSVLREGGFQTFGLLLPEQADRMSEKLNQAGILHRVERVPDRRHIVR